MAHAASRFTIYDEILDIWYEIVSFAFIFDMLKRHQLDNPQDFVISRRQKKTFFIIFIRSALLCYAVRIWCQWLHLFCG